MNKVLFLILSLLSIASAQRATITLLQPRMFVASTNEKAECNVKDTSDAANLVLDNCPGGATCVESANGKGRCTIFTLAEHQGATAFDYTASRVVRAETQLASNGAALDCDLQTISATVPANQEDRFRCIEHAAHLFLGDNEATSEYETYCNVTYEGSIGLKMTSGTMGTRGMDLPAGQTLNSGFYANSAAKQLSCHYLPENNKFLGYGYAKITFHKKTAALGLGEKSAKIIKVPMRFVPGNQVDAGDPDGDDNNYPDDPALTNAHDLLSMKDSNDGITGSTSDKGQLQLTYKLNVMDKRYLINSQSGVEVLKQAAGNFDLIKEGLEIHSDYATFYDASTNDFLNAGVQAAPLDYGSYETGNCTKKGQSAGASLAVTNCNIGGDYYGRDYAQYELAGTYKATYGGLKHWKKGYIGCQLCSNRLAVQGFSTQSAPQIDVAVDIDVTTLESGCVKNDTAGSLHTCITLDNIFADPVGAGVENGKALRLPNCDGTLNNGALQNCGSTGGYDPQHADGHVLGEFFTPKLEGTTSYGDYDSDFDFLSTSRLIVTDSSKLKNATSSSGLTISAQCASAGQGKVYTMSADMLAAANDLFYNKCRIVVRNVDFAKKSNIVFFKSGSDKTSCTTDDCTNAVYAEITQVDGRRILVGDAELSLLRRKLATVEKAGAAITMSIAKYTESASQVLHFDIVGTNTMMGYNAANAKCTTALVSSDTDCTEEAVDSELTFVSSAVNGERKLHVIRSSPSCTGFLDVQMRDKNDTFAIYDLRIPCSRTTASARDEIALTYDFTFGYDLGVNKVTAKAYYLSSMSSFNVSNITVGSATSGLKQDLVVSASYGYCSSGNVIQRKNASGDFVGCAGTADANGKWADQSNQQHFTSTGLNLNEWSHCAQSVQDDSASDSYIVTTKIAMNYQRKLKYTSSTGQTMSTNNFCADRTFITTIKRDATATVTVATLRAPTLERAVSVTDISWVACNNPNPSNEFKLEITVASSQKDTTATNSNWAASNLKTVLKPTSSSSADSDSLMVNVGGMTTSNPLASFKLQSNCIVVSAADCDERCDADGDNCAAQTTAGDTSDSAYSQLTHTATDLVLRGEFTNSDVDSDVNIVTKYVECPLDESNQASGYLRAGATLDCDAAITTAASPTVANDADCTQAFTTDLGQADVKLYISNSSAANHKLTAAEATAASSANWNIRHASIYIERYEKNFDGQKGSLLSSEEFCECGTKTVEYNASTQCVEKADRIFGLIPFSTLECGKNTTNSFSYDRIRFNFLPLADATNDIFEVKFVLLAENTDLDEALPSRRRLRSVTHSTAVVNRKQLGATQSVSASPSGISFVQPSYNTADDAVPAAPPSVTAAPVGSETANTTTTTAAPEDLSTGAIIGIIAGVVVVLAAIIGALWYNKVWCFADDDNTGGQSVGMKVNDGEVVMWPGAREQRFSNLRY